MPGPTWDSAADRLRSIPTLDGWRAIAVLLVLSSHCQTMLRNNGSSIAVALADIVKHAGYGVDIFFAISGFLITTLLLQEKETGGNINFSSFYTRRAFRIMPPIIGYLAAICALNAFFPLGIARSEIISVLLFFRNYVEGTWYTQHFWSLAIEEHFYLFVPLIVALFPWRRSLAIFCVAAIACAAIRWLEDAFLGGKIDFRTEARFDALMYGSAFAVIVTRPVAKAWLVKNLTLLQCALLLVVVVACLHFMPYLPIRRTLVAAVAPVFIVYTTLHPTEFVGRTLQLSSIRWVGRLSYSLYIWQMPFLTPFARPIPAVQDFPLNLLCAVACAVASYYLIERPSISMGRAMLKLSARVSPKQVAEGYVMQPQELAEPPQPV
jgi:peptidoglycan/LPS O-acetylase OafA/YrhL